MSWLSRFSLAQRALVGLMSIIALVFGAIAIPQLKQQLLPTIELCRFCPGMVTAMGVSMEIVRTALAADFGFRFEATSAM